MPRYFLVTLILTLAGGASIVKAIVTMTVGREPWIAMSSLLVKENRPLPAKRGNILAADGQILASSLPEYQMFFDFMSSERDSLLRQKDQYRRDTLLKDSLLNVVCTGMHNIFPDIDPAKLKAHLLEGRKKGSRYWPVYTADVSSLPIKQGRNRQITYLEYSEVRKLPIFSNNSSVNYVKVEMRKRPFGHLAIRTIGEYKAAADDEYKGTARYGLELTFDSILRGQNGAFHYQKVMNRKVKVEDKPAIDGCDIVTTLDVNMQQIVEQALSEKLKEINAVSGVCILMETATGDIKAMSSLSRHEDGSYAEDRALAVTDLYEPGSVFKPQSFLVAFDDGEIKMTDQVNVGGGVYNFGSRKMKDHNWRSGGYGTLTVPQIIGNSSNVGVSVLINEHYHDNPRRFVDGLHRVGSAEDLKIPLPGYEKPRIRHPGEGNYWSQTTLPWMSIGYETQITPINTLNFYNGIANNGKLLRPRLVKAIKRGGEVIKEYPVVVLREHMAKAEAVRNIQECLEYVTTRGVGKAAASKLFPVAGKTGTAQIWTGGGRTSEYFVTFAGYFPADKPLYSCIVCIRKPAPASGGGQCGPVFRRVAESVMARQHMVDYSAARDTLRAADALHCQGNMTATARLFNQLGLTVNTTLKENATPTWGTSCSVHGLTSIDLQKERADIVPDVTGYGLSDAVCRLEDLGLRVRTNGVGRVTAQSLPYGHQIKQGEVITLTLGRVKKAHATISKSATSVEKKTEAVKPQPTTVTEEKPSATQKLTAAKKQEAAKKEQGSSPKKQESIPKKQEATKKKSI